MVLLLNKAISFFNIDIMKSIHKKRNFVNNQYYNTDMRTYALHEVSHAVSLRLYDDHKKIEQKKIVIKSKNNSYFSYKRNEDPNARELYVDMIVCLSGFVSELKLLGIESTSAYQDIIDWEEESKRWLTHYCNDYIATPETEAEVRWNIQIMNKHKKIQSSIIQDILFANKDAIYDFVDFVCEKKKAKNDDISKFLDKIIIPEIVDEKINSIMNEAYTEWV